MRGAAPRPTASLVAVAAIAGVLAVLAPAPAEAHPFGPPPTARVWAEGDAVTIDWGAAPDDLAAIGVQLDLLPEDLPEQYLEAPTQVAPDPEHEERLADSPELRRYLLERVRVWQDGEPCDGEVRPIERFLTRGVTILHRCPEPVDEVEIEISLLHGIHPAYRTFAFSASDRAEPSQAVFTPGTPRHTWRFEPRSDDERDTSGPNPGLLGLIALGVLAIAGIVAAEVLGGRDGDGGDDDDAGESVS